MTALIEPIGQAAAAYGAHRAALTAPATAASPIASPAKVMETAAAAETGPGSFTAFMDRQVTQAVDTLKASESASIAAVAGKASAQEVVRSVMAAEMTVQAVVSIRDRMVQAYQDIMRMAI
jgi:flagellar hook-basal body complex protein FliE